MENKDLDYLNENKKKDRSVYFQEYHKKRKLKMEEKKIPGAEKSLFEEKKETLPPPPPDSTTEEKTKKEPVKDIGGRPFGAKDSKQRKTPDQSWREEKKKISKPFSQFPKPLCLLIAEMIPFAILAALSKIDDFKLTNQEKEILAPMWDLTLTKHIPDAVGKFGEEAILISTIAGILMHKPINQLLKKLPGKTDGKLHNRDNGEKGFRENGTM